MTDPLLAILHAFQDSYYQDWDTFSTAIIELEIETTFRRNDRGSPALFDLVLRLHELGDGFCSKDIIEGMVEGMLAMLEPNTLHIVHKGGEVFVETGTSERTQTCELAMSQDKKG